MRIRPAREDEREALEDLQRRASLALGTYNVQLEAHPDVIHLPLEQIASGDVLVAEAEGAIFGFAVLLEKDGGAELDGLFVDPARWRQGIGAKLVIQAVRLARNRGLSLVTVIAEPGARQFYEKCGFCVEGEAQTRFGPALRMSR